jgi:uncharacterized membrane protein
MFGHPLHPAIVHFPIALLLSATAADLAWLAGLTSDSHFGAILMAAGLVTGLAAMGAGLIDFAKLDDAIVPHAVRHVGAVGMAWLGYAVALYLRRESLLGAAPLELPGVIVSIVSGLLLALGGWLGGKLVYSFGAGVSDQPP